MTKKFKVYSNKTETRIVLESMTAGATGSANIASAPRGQKLVQSRNMEAADKVPQKPRQGPLRPQTGGGKHQDKKRAQKQGKEKHRKPFMEDDISKKRDLLLTLKDVNPTLETNYLELASVNELEDMLFQWADETEQKLRELEQQAKTSKVAKQKFQELKAKWDMVQQKLYGISETGMAEGLYEAVGGNYLYHATSAAGLNGILSAGSIRAAIGPQAVTQAQTKLPTVSVTRDWGYASGSNAQTQIGGIGRDVVLVLDRNAVESNFKTLGTSQSTQIKGLAFNPFLKKDGEARSQNTDAMARTNAKAKSKYAEPTAKAGGEFEEAVIVPKGALPLKGTMVGFWVNPKSELMKDPTIMDDPRRLDMVRPNQFVKATQQQGVAEGLEDKTAQQRKTERDKQRTTPAQKARNQAQRKGLQQDKDGTYYAKEGVAEGSESQFMAARYIDEFGDGDHWYVKGSPDTIKRFVQLANSLEDEAVKGTDYEPGVGGMAKIHKQLGNDQPPQWKIVPAQNLEQLEPIDNQTLAVLMKADLSAGAQEFMSDFLWDLESDGQAVVHGDLEQGVSEGSDTDLSAKNIAALLYNVSHYGDGQEGEIRDHAISMLARKFNNRQKATDLIDKTDLGDEVVRAYHELRRQGVKENHPDHEISMSRSELYTIVKQATELFKLLAQRSEMEGLEAWQQSKITKAADYLNAVHRSVNYDEQYGDNDQSGVAEGDYRNPRYHQVYGDPGENTPDETYIVKKFYFNVPFDQKDTAKSLKMMWDRDLKKWYLPKWSTSGIKFEQRLMSAKAAFGEPLDIKGSMEEDKIKGVDGKACWKGKRYAGREKKADGTYKDICKEDSYLDHLNSILNEKMASQQQSNLMHAAANDPAVAKKTRVSQKVAREFVKASHGQEVSKLPKRVKKSK